MKNSTSLEARLRSWKPRGPSPRLEQRLWPTAALTPAVPAGAALSGWLADSRHLLSRIIAPAAACLLLIAGMSLRPDVGGDPMSVAALNDRDFAASLSMQNAPHNALTAPIFGWTPDPGSPSSSAPLQPLQTNCPKPGL